MLKTKHRKKYSSEYRDAAVEYFLQNQCQISFAAARFDISPGMLHKWVDKYKEQHEISRNSGDYLHRTVEHLGKEVLQLKHDVGILRSIIRKQLTDKVNSINDNDVVKSIVGE